MKTFYGLSEECFDVIKKYVRREITLDATVDNAEIMGKLVDAGVLIPDRPFRTNMDYIRCYNFTEKGQDLVNHVYERIRMNSRTHTQGRFKNRDMYALFDVFSKNDLWKEKHDVRYVLDNVGIDFDEIKAAANRRCLSCVPAWKRDRNSNDIIGMEYSINNIIELAIIRYFRNFGMGYHEISQIMAFLWWYFKIDEALISAFYPEKITTGKDYSDVVLYIFVGDIIGVSFNWDDMPTYTYRLMDHKQVKTREGSLDREIGHTKISMRRIYQKLTNSFEDEEKSQ